MEAFEKLGAFYLGKTVALGEHRRTDDLLLYDAKDLTTHGLCVGMTGSGKTGLCMALIEEAAIDGIPVIAIDPKGDIGNLMLRFPDLLPSNFRPWIDESEAARKGLTPDAFARKTAETWTSGLERWGQDSDRIQRLVDRADVVIYTPGSRAGRPLTVLRSFNVPSAAVMANGDALGAHIQSAVSGLLGLLGLDTDPLASREHILLSTVITRAWQEGRDLSLGDLILAIQKPPFSKVGVFDLDTFFPPADRMKLALALNGLIAAPGFQNWMTGESLDIQNLLYGPGGKPRVSILSIAHLSDAERMFFVTLLLNELISWMRQQPGTGSLRAVCYMDEIYGYFPPSKNPPSKTPMLTLLKQARAFGLGMLLATQNPVDLDYKGLSNTGTWFIGRLQTERDKLRVLDGLEGASSAGLDRAKMERLVTGLDSRVFLMHNVHEDGPQVFETRWVLSYLRGPLTLEQIRTLTPSTQVDIPVQATTDPLPAAGTDDRATGPVGARPVVAASVKEGHLGVARPCPPGARCLYRPALLAGARARYAKAGLGLDEWRRFHLMVELPESGELDWNTALPVETAFSEMEESGQSGFDYVPLPEGATQSKTFNRWEKDLAGHIYRDRPLILFRCRSPKENSIPGESEDAFRGRLVHRAREQRDLKIEKLRKRYGKRLATCEDRIRRAEQRLARETEQYQAAKMNTVVSIGATVIGALFGRKLTGYRTVSGAGSSVRRAQRATIERGDIRRAEAELDSQRANLAEMTSAFQDEVADIEAAFDPAHLELEVIRVFPRKSDITVPVFGLVWIPWAMGTGGVMEKLTDSA